MAAPPLPDEIELRIAGLIEAIASEDGDVLAARRPLLFGDPSRVEPRVRALADDPRWEARAAVAEVLRYLVGPVTSAPPRPIPGAVERATFLAERLAQERDPRVRRALLAAFVDLREDVGRDVARPIACRGAGDPDPDVRASAAAVLGGDPDPMAIDTLVLLSTDPDGTVRDGACFALGHLLGSPRMPGGIEDSDRIREALAARLDDPDDEAREEAATGLALRGDERGIDRVVALLAGFDEEGVSERVLATAAEAPDARYLAALEHVVRERPDLRTAVEALEECRAVVPRRDRRCATPRHAGCDCFRGLPGLPAGIDVAPGRSR